MVLQRYGNSLILKKVLDQYLYIKVKYFLQTLRLHLKKNKITFLQYYMKNAFDNLNYQRH